MVTTFGTILAALFFGLLFVLILAFCFEGDCCSLDIKTDGYTIEQRIELLKGDFLYGTLLESGKGFIEIGGVKHSATYKFYHDSPKPFYIFKPDSEIYVENIPENRFIDPDTVKLIDKNGINIKLSKSNSEKHKDLISETCYIKEI